jgi:hypothetical protein
MIEHNLTNGLITLSIGSVAASVVLLILKLIGAPIANEALVLPLIVGLACIVALIVIVIVDILEESNG